MNRSTKPSAVLDVTIKDNEMDNENVTYTNQQHWASRHDILAIILLSIFIIFSVGIFFFSPAEVVWEREIANGFIFAILGMALGDSYFEVRQKERPWRQLASRTGLNCRIGNFFMGYPVQVSGDYRGRSLTLYTHKQGKGQVPSTRIEVRVNNSSKASLRVCGPFNPKQVASDRIVNQMFGAAGARQFGHERRFFIRSQPLHLAMSMLRVGSLQDRLLALRPFGNIELSGQALYFEQLGVLKDVEYLNFIFDLLSDLADLIEKGYVAPRLMTV